MELERWQCRHFGRQVIVAGTLTPDSCNRQDEVPDLTGFFKPPHLPIKSTPLGARALSRSMMVAAFGEPSPKLTVLRTGIVRGRRRRLAFPVDVTVELLGKLGEVVLEVGQKNVIAELIQRHSCITRKPVSSNLQSFDHVRDRILFKNNT